MEQGALLWVLTHQLRYLWRLQRSPTPVVFNHLLPLVDTFPSSFQRHTGRSVNNTVLRSTACDTTTPDCRISQTFFATLLTPQQVVLSQNVPVVTRLRRSCQVTWFEIWQDIECQLVQQHQRTIIYIYINAIIAQNISTLLLGVKVLMNYEIMCRLSYRHSTGHKQN